MLTMLYSPDWIAGRDAILKRVSENVDACLEGNIIIVPELISHDMERRLCATAGDAASRYAEVLSFTRLARRVAEYTVQGLQPCLDNGGRVVAMAAAARLLHSQLKAYASVETRPEFLTGLVDAVDEFKRCCICPADLKRAAEQTEGSLAQKLEELSLLLETYDALCLQGKRDPRDQMTWLLEQLEESTFAQDHRIFMDGFPDLTRQHMAIIEFFIRSGTPVTVSVNCDRINSDAPEFEKAGKTAAELIACAKKWNIEVQSVYVEESNKELRGLGNVLFHGELEQGKYQDKLFTYRTETVYDECIAVADRITELVQHGARYRDIGIVCADVSAYQNAVNMVFHRCNIPSYIAGTDDILEKSVITTVLCALDAALNGFDRRDVIRYLRSMLSPITLEQCDKVENYSIMWSVSGRNWHTKWTNHPWGLSESWTEHAQAALDELNALREKAIKPLERLADQFETSVCLKDQIQALYGFLEDINLSERLANLAAQMDGEGQNREAQILNQLWEILLGALEQLYDVLGDAAWDSETFTRLLRLLLSQYDVGTIPAVLDAVTIGSVSAMRCQQTKHLFVLGALEGAFPGYSGTNGVLTDHERTQLRMLGVPLTGGAMEGLQAEFAEIYGVFCGATETVSVSCPGGQPSYVYRRLVTLAGGEKQPEAFLGAILHDKTEAGAYMARIGHGEGASSLGIVEEYNKILALRAHELGQVSRKNIEGLYGDALYLSASQIDKQANCRLAYFFKYGLRVKERKSITVDPAEFGTYVHAVMENTVNEIISLGGFKQISMEDTLAIAKKYSDAYAAEHFSVIDSERITYLFNRNIQELNMVVEELWQEMQESDFAPVGCEIGFGEGEQMPAIPVFGKTMRAFLRGYVDRVDMWQREDESYFRVVDYKTGKKDFDYCDIFNGLGLQMLLYLFTLEDEGEQILGADSRSAGVQYFPARAPVISVDGVVSDEEAQAQRQSSWIRRGLILSDEAVLNAMETSGEMKRLCCKKKKDGTISGDIADAGQFDLLKKYVFTLVGKMVDQIASGYVDPNPYTRGSSHNACAYCPYGNICHQQQVEGRRNYKAMSAQRFWEEIGKELNGNG